MTDEPREETRPDEEQDVEGHGALSGEPRLEPRLHSDEESDEDVEGHMRLEPGIGPEPSIGP